jgi:hypothetical protein
MPGGSLRARVCTRAAMRHNRRLSPVVWYALAEKAV